MKYVVLEIELIFHLYTNKNSYSCGSVKFQNFCFHIFFKFTVEY